MADSPRVCAAWTGRDAAYRSSTSSGCDPLRGLAAVQAVDVRLSAPCVASSCMTAGIVAGVDHYSSRRLSPIISRLARGGLRMVLAGSQASHIPAKRLQLAGLPESVRHTIHTKQRRSCERDRIGRLIEWNYEAAPAAIRLRVPIRQYQGSDHVHGVTSRIEQEEMSQTARRSIRGASSPLRIVADASLSRNPKCCVSV